MIGNICASTEFTNISKLKKYRILGQNSKLNRPIDRTQSSSFKKIHHSHCILEWNSQNDSILFSIVTLMLFCLVPSVYEIFDELMTNFDSIINAKKAETNLTQ